MAVARSGIKIVKNSGNVEFFDPNVITNECIEAGIEFFTAAEVALEVSKVIYDGISTKEIQEAALEILYKKYPEVAERYKRFHSMQVRTSRNTIEPFDRKKIAASLVKETGLPREIGDTIAKESEAELRRLKLDFISSPLIREIVNVKLLEHGFEEARGKYTRLGMPIYDAANLIENYQDDPASLHHLVAGSIFKEYTLLKVLPLHLADAHMKGDIHIHGLAYFATKPYSAVHDFRWLLKKGIRLNSICMEPPRTPEQAMLQAVKVMSASADFYGPQILDFFNVYLAPYIKGLGYEEVKELAKMYLYESQPARNDVRIFIEYGCPEELESKTAVLPGGEAKKGVKYSDFEDESRMLGNAIADAYLEGDYSGNSFTSPTSYYRVRKASEGKEGYESFMITVHKASLHFGTPVFVGSGMPENTLQIVTLNLPRIAYTSGGDESEFYETLDTRLNMVREVLMLKREIMEQKGVSSYYSLDNVAHSIGYLGVNEMAKVMKGSELHESSSSLEFGIEVVRHIYETAKKWSDENGLYWTVAQPPNKLASYRLAKLDYGKFSSSAVVQRDAKSNVRYTNASSVRDGVPVKDMLKVAGAFHLLNTGGTKEEIEISYSNPKALFKFSCEIADMQLQYWSYKRV